jgi:hypothetical protein
VAGIVAVEAGLALGEHNRTIGPGEMVSGAFGITVFLFSAVAWINVWASRSPTRRYLSILPVVGWWPFPPDISVAFGVLIGLVFGVLYWT